MSTPPPCAGLWELFDSTDPGDHARAAAMCRTCPMLAECERRLESARNKSHRPVHDYGPVGTWAGHLVGAPARLTADRDRIEQAMFTADELREHHNLYNAGIRSERTIVAERVYQRNRKRRAAEEKRAA